MDTETVFRIGPFLVGLGFIFISLIILVFIDKFIHFLYYKSWYRNLRLWGDKPEYSITRAKMGGTILGLSGIIIILIVLRDYFIS